MEIKALFLVEIFGNKSCFILDYAFIYIFLYPKNPFAANILSMKRKSRKCPSVILYEWVILNFHCLKPSRLNQSLTCSTWFSVDYKGFGFRVSYIDVCEHKMVINRYIDLGILTMKGEIFGVCRGLCVKGRKRGCVVKNLR